MSAVSGMEKGRDEGGETDVCEEVDCFGAVNNTSRETASSISSFSTLSTVRNATALR